MNAAAWGHSVSALLQQLPEPWQATEEVIQTGKELDKHYIPARYPNSYPEGAPLDYYTEEEAGRAISYSEQIYSFCKNLLDQS
jgi:HEPN domain-containing protein